jgi:hypothetical protein
LHQRASLGELVEWVIAAFADLLVQWTSHYDILQICHHAGVDLPRDAITSAEHKVNGKTKG